MEPAAGQLPQGTREEGGRLSPVLPLIGRKNSTTGNVDALRSFQRAKLLSAWRCAGWVVIHFLRLSVARF